MVRLLCCCMCVFAVYQMLLWNIGLLVGQNKHLKDLIEFEKLHICPLVSTWLAKLIISKSHSEIYPLTLQIYAP